jgi:hypothetical protein
LSILGLALIAEVALDNVFVEFDLEFFFDLISTNLAAEIIANLGPTGGVF